MMSIAPSILSLKKIANQSKKRFAIAASILLIIIFLGVTALVNYLNSSPDDPDQVALDWNSALFTLGIVGVFPPTEDMHVGDVYANEYARPEKTFMYRSIKLGSIPGVNEIIQKTYKNMLRFPETPKKPPEDNEISAEDIFTSSAKLSSLPLVVFPGVKVKSELEGNATGLLAFVKSSLGFSGRASRSIQVSIPNAVTFGIGGADAVKLLDDFCMDEYKAEHFCTVNYIRRMLDSGVWHKVKSHSLLISDAGPKNERSLRLITRLYLAREIHYEYGNDTSVASSAKSNYQKATGGQNGPDGKGLVSNQNLENDAIEKAANVAGGKVVLGSISESGVSMTVQLSRPLVIGYESITALPYHDLPEALASNNKPAQKGN